MRQICHPKSRSPPFLCLITVCRLRSTASTALPTTCTGRGIARSGPCSPASTGVSGSATAAPLRSCARRVTGPLCSKTPISWSSTRPSWPTTTATWPTAASTGSLVTTARPWTARWPTSPPSSAGRSALPDLLRRAGRALRRPVQGGQRSGPALRGRGPDVPARLLPPDHRRRRTAAALLPGLRPAPLAPARRGRRPARRTTCRSASSCPGADRPHAGVEGGRRASAVLLLDTDVPENHPADRPITSILYVRGREMRSAPGDHPRHGRIRGAQGTGNRAGRLAPQRGALGAVCSLEQASRPCARARSPSTRHSPRSRASTVFTTHTPVPRATSASTPSWSASDLRRAGPTALDVERVLELGLGVDAGCRHRSIMTAWPCATPTGPTASASSTARRRRDVVAARSSIPAVEHHQRRAPARPGSEPMRS